MRIFVGVGVLSAVLLKSTDSVAFPILKSYAVYNLQHVEENLIKNFIITFEEPYRIISIRKSPDNPLSFLSVTGTFSCKTREDLLNNNIFISPFNPWGFRILPISIRESEVELFNNFEDRSLAAFFSIGG